MMEAVSGSVTAAGIHLKVAAGMDKEKRDGRNRGEDTKKERWSCIKVRIWLATEQDINSMSENERTSENPGKQGKKEQR